jgi:hypothetical protein
LVDRRRRRSRLMARHCSTPSEWEKRSAAGYEHRRRMETT